MNAKYQIISFLDPSTIDNKDLVNYATILNNEGECLNLINFGGEYLFETSDQYNTEGLHFLLNLDLQKKALFLHHSNNSSFFSCNKFNNYVNLSIVEIGSLNIDKLVAKIIPDLLTKKAHMIYYDNYWYHFFQANDSISMYLVKKIKHDKYPKVFDEKLQMEIINISKNVGKEHHFDEFTFYTTYKMWFGPVAIAKFGRERILSFQEAEHLRELPHGLIEMQLCDHIDRCDSPENIRRQKALLNHLGIEHYPAEELKSPTSGRIGWLRKWLDK